MIRTERWSLRRRIVVLSGSVLVMILLVALVGFLLALRSILAQSATDSALTQTYELAHTVSVGQATAAEAVDHVASRGTIMQALDSDGVVLGSSERLHATTPLVTTLPPPGETQVTQLADGIEGDGDPFVVAAQTVIDPVGEQVTMVVAQPLEVETRTIESASLLLGGGGAALALLLLVLVDRIVDRALEPVRRIAGQVDQITRARTSERLTVPPTGDEIADLAGTMNGMLERLARSEEATQRFVSDASHELRSPLATLRTHVETAHSGDEVDLDLVRAEVLRVQSLVDDLLTLAKSDDRGLRLALEPLDLDEIVAAEAHRLRAVTDAQVTVNIDPVEVRGDGGRLTQVIRNLTDNARRHTTGGIRLVMENTQTEARVHVDNAGPVLPPEAREVVFQRFARLDDSRERDRGGSGLGLAIARTLAEAHGGTLTTGEAPDGWCRFTLTLPRDDV